MAETLQMLYARRNQENAGRETQAPAAPAETAVPEIQAPVREDAAPVETISERMPQPVQTATEAAHRRRARK